MAVGRDDSSRAQLQALGMGVGPLDPSTRARLLAPSPDTLGWIARLRAAEHDHALDADVHAKLSDLMIRKPAEQVNAVIEAFAARVVRGGPKDWRRWAGAQLAIGRHDAAEKSLERYFVMGGADARDDSSAVRVRDALRRELSGVSTAGAAR